MYRHWIKLRGIHWNTVWNMCIEPTEWYSIPTWYLKMPKIKKKLFTINPFTMKVTKYHWRKSLHVPGNYWTFSNFRGRQFFGFHHKICLSVLNSLFARYKDKKKATSGSRYPPYNLGYMRRGAKPPSCIIPLFAECQTRIYVSYRSHTEVSYNQTLGYLSYNQTSATCETNMVLQSHMFLLQQKENN